MDLISLAVLVVVIVAVVAIVAWFVRSSGVAIPQPVLIALWAILAIVMILAVASLAGVGPNLRWR